MRTRARQCLVEVLDGLYEMGLTYDDVETIGHFDRDCTQFHLPLLLSTPRLQVVIIIGRCPARCLHDLPPSSRGLTLTTRDERPFRMARLRAGEPDSGTEVRHGGTSPCRSVSSHGKRGVTLGVPLNCLLYTSD